MPQGPIEHDTPRARCSPALAAGDSPTQIGVSVWDTAGQDRFSSLTPFYFRGAQGIVYVYDVTRRDSLQHLADKWMEDYKNYATVEDAVQMVVGNKVDLGEGVRQVTPEEGAAFAREHGCMYKETSAKTDSGGTDAGVYDALVWGMVCTILDSRPALLQDNSGGGGVRVDARRRRRGGGRGGALPCC